MDDWSLKLLLNFILLSLINTKSKSLNLLTNSPMDELKFQVK